MTKNETVQIMAIITAAYPRFYDKQTETDKVAALRLWYRHFGNVDYGTMLQAVDAVISTNKFPPTISEINEKLDLLLSKDDEMSELEAWAIVRKALCNSGYNYMEEYAKLPEPLRRIVGDAHQLHEWAMMDETTVNSVIASNFQRTYRARAEADKQRAYLPERRQAYLREHAMENNGIAPASGRGLLPI